MASRRGGVAREHADQLGRLQEIIFPTLAPEQRFLPEHYLKHIELFPEGQFAAVDGVRGAGGHEDAGHQRVEVLQQFLQAHEVPRRLLGRWGDVWVGDVAQREVVANGAYSSRLDIEPPLGSLPLKDVHVAQIDFEALERDTPAIKKKFAEIFQ